ncbi:MAG: L,D-transpeptidase [Acidobacteriia bacterium]|nr:L,D-transpeptidase [Terriglobia bacterium]
MPSYRVTFALFLAFGAQSYAAQHRPSANRVAPAPSIDAGAINDSRQTPLSNGDKGSGVVRAQILLDRAHFSCGQIDGKFGTNLQKTVAAFQSNRGMPASGAMDDATWAALNADQAPVLTAYTISPDDEKGPFVTIPHDMTAQARMSYLGYSSPLEELGERFHTSPAALQALNPGADFSRAGQQITVPNVVTLPPGQAARVEVSKSESSVRAYGADGKLLAFYVATIGSVHDPLPVGDWKIRGVQHNPAFHYNAELFWDAHNPHEKAVIQPGPNNPVGLVWIDLSKEHYGIHGTPDPGEIGHVTSHGCIRLTNWDALELASMVKPGTPAILKE